MACVLYHSDAHRGTASASTGFFAASRYRIEWASSLSSEDDELQFTAIGPASRTLLVAIYPSDRVAEDAIQSRILRDSDESDFRKELVAHGFLYVQTQDLGPKALPKTRAVNFKS
jgi:hypothetical protein